jgi:hypothetical protein
MAKQQPLERGLVHELKHSGLSTGLQVHGARPLQHLGHTVLLPGPFHQAQLQAVGKAMYAGCSDDILRHDIVLCGASHTGKGSIIQDALVDHSKQGQKGHAGWCKETS